MKYFVYAVASQLCNYSRLTRGGLCAISNINIDFFFFFFLEGEEQLKQKNLGDKINSE